MSERAKHRNIKTLALVLAVVLVLVTAGVLLAAYCHDYGDEVPLGKTDRGYLFVQTCRRCGRTQERYYTAMLTFIDDDAKTQAMLHWERIIDATGIEMTSALIPGKIQPATDYDTWHSYAGWDLLERMEEKGVDYVHHTYNHQRLSGFTAEQMHEDFQLSKEILSAHGIHSDLLVYPFYNHNETVHQVASMYFDAAFGGQRDESFNYAIHRTLITDPTVTKTITFPNGKTAECHATKSAAKLENELDAAVENGEWLVYVTHAYDSPAGQFYFDEQAEQDIIDFCFYAKELGNVKIVTATEGYQASQPID